MEADVEIRCQSVHPNSFKMQAQQKATRTLRFVCWSFLRSTKASINTVPGFQLVCWTGGSNLPSLFSLLAVPGLLQQGHQGLSCQWRMCASLKNSTWSWYLQSKTMQNHANMSSSYWVAVVRSPLRAHICPLFWNTRQLLIWWQHGGGSPRYCAASKEVVHAWQNVCLHIVFQSPSELWAPHFRIGARCITPFALVYLWLCVCVIRMPKSRP